MDDKQINTIVEERTQAILLALHKEISQLSMRHDERIKVLESKIKGIEAYVRELQLNTGAY